MTKFYISFILVFVLTTWFFSSGGDWLGGLMLTAQTVFFITVFTGGSLAPSLIFWGITLFIYLVWNANANKSRRLRASAATSVMCAKCDQYLGTGNSYSMPCPRCGSNRYYTE